MPDYQFACKSSDVAAGSMLLVELDDRLVIVLNVEGEYYCIDDVCTHDGGTLSDGQLDGCQVTCPRHGAKFDVRTGEALTMPATEPTGCHEIKVDGDSVLVKIRE